MIARYVEKLINALQGWAMWLKRKTKLNRSGINMTILGKEVAFDLDVRVDLEKYVAAWEKLQSPIENVKNNTNAKDGITFIDAIKAFLSDCLGEAAAELLADGRISTITQAYVDFVTQANEQQTNIAERVNAAADAINKVYKNAGNAAKNVPESVLADVPEDVT